MKTLTLAAIAGTALLGLSACEQSAPADVEEEMAADPAAAMPAEETSATGDRVSISEDGIEATVNDGDTSVSADVDDDPSMTVETE
ncbi:MAG TPA: hypothetical protein VGA34_08155 [Alteraurantiacibacter sp.]|jgi:hypothetical protein